jgi:hypothetical protein
MRVSRRSLLSRMFDDGDWLEDWSPPDPAAAVGAAAAADALIANMSQEEARELQNRARTDSPLIDPRLSGRKEARRHRAGGSGGRGVTRRARDSAPAP